MKATVIFEATNILLVLESGNSVEFNTLSGAVNYCEKYNICADFKN